MAWPKGVPRKKAASPFAQDGETKQVEKSSIWSKMKAKPNWDDNTYDFVGEEGVDRLKIPQEIIDNLARDGVALQWITKSVRGQETPQEMAKFTKGGWTPVSQSDFDGVLDGMFMSKGIDDVITVDDCMLVARPMELQAKAKLRERADARRPLQIKEAEIGHGIPGVSGADHPSATRQNQINRTVERIEIPD